MPRREIHACISASIIVLLGALGCANADDVDLGRITPQGDAGDSTVDFDANRGDTTMSFDVGETDAAVSGLGCSGDLLHVVDSKGIVVRDCPPDQGCSAGACVPACEAAAKSMSSIGCDFIVPTPAYEWAANDVGQPCYAIYLANNWDDSLTISVDYGGAKLDPSTFARIGTNDPDPTKWSPVGASGLPRGQVAILFMSSDPDAKQHFGTPPSTIDFPQNCAVSPAVAHDTTIPNVAPYKGKSGVGKAFHIKTSRPVSAYDIMPFGGATSFLTGAELLLPTTAWSTNYVVTMSPSLDTDPAPAPSAVSAGDGYLQVVATQDDTHVQVAVTKDLYVDVGSPVALPDGPSVAAAPAGAVTSYTLNAGDYIQWFGRPYGLFLGSSPLEATGTIFSSDKPIGVFSGDTVVDVGRAASGPAAGTTARAADGERHPILPISAMGFEYAAPPYVTRSADLKLENTLYRVMAFVDGTKLVFDPPIAGGPTTLDQGKHADFVTDKPFVVHSQDKDHPFYLAQVMGGAEVNAASRPGIDTAVESTMTFGGPAPTGGTLGDPDFLPLVPPAQFLTHYAFFTDPTYATTNLVLTRVAKSDGTFDDVTVDCVGTIGAWTALGTDKRFQYAQVDLVRAKVSVGGCENGAHSAKSASPFGLYVFGTDYFVSYSYPAGGNLTHLNDVVVPATIK